MFLKVFNRQFWSAPYHPCLQYIQPIPPSETDGWTQNHMQLHIFFFEMPYWIVSYLNAFEYDIKRSKAINFYSNEPLSHVPYVFCIQPVHSHKYVTFAFIFCIKKITQMHFVYSILTFFYHPHHHQQHTKFYVLLPSNNIIYTNIVNSVSFCIVEQIVCFLSQFCAFWSVFSVPMGVCVYVLCCDKYMYGIWLMMSILIYFRVEYFCTHTKPKMKQAINYSLIPFYEYFVSICQIYGRLFYFLSRSLIQSKLWSDFVMFKCI